MAQPSDAPVPPATIRAWFAEAMAAMYAREVPLYATLVEIVARMNAETLASGGQKLAPAEIARLGAERHGAIRLGLPSELAALTRVFTVMGMAPVDYYDLAAAGIPVHSTAFRPIDAVGLTASPFRIFTSLLRLDLIADAELRDTATAILSRRRILSDAALMLTARSERAGGLTEGDARHFVAAVLETFRWHARSTVDRSTYRRLSEAHRLVADVVAFPGPHINHLTPRTLDIDRAHAEMARRGIPAKTAIEGPPPRAVPILLRQTSFHALEEQVRFAGEADSAGAHTARFGEIEQRGVALTPAGRALYDRLLAQAEGADGLCEGFRAFPDSIAALRRDRLAFFRYTATDAGRAAHRDAPANLDHLIEAGHAVAEPLTYEDFLPVSAAGIFQSNLGPGQRQHYRSEPARAEFEAALGRPIVDPVVLYAEEQRASTEHLLAELGVAEP